MKKNLLLTLFFVFAGTTFSQLRYAGRVTGFSREYRSYPESWCATQILGAPNVYPQYDDINGAWTPKRYGDQRDWISVGFDNNSPIDSIIIWETSSAGMVDSVYVKNPNTSKWDLIFSRKPNQIPNSADTIARILRIGFPKTSYNVNEVMIQIANDSATDWVELDAVAIHPATLTPTTYSNQALYAADFDGNDDYYRTNYSSWHHANKTNFTVMCWLQVTADTALKQSRVNRGAGVVWDADYRSYGISHVNLGFGDSLYAFVDFDNSGQIAIPYTKFVWQHVAMVNTEDTLFAYVNGNLIGKSQGSFFDSFDTYGILEFGRNYDYETYFKGSIDEVKTFNAALDAAEIMRQSYSIGQSAVTSNLVGYWQFNNGLDSALWNGYTHLSDSLHNGARYINTGTILAVKKIQPTADGLYPNPNNGSFKIHVANNDHSVLVRIIDLQGKVQFEGNLPVYNHLATVQLPDLSKGIYFLQTAGNTRKFVVE